LITRVQKTPVDDGLRLRAQEHYESQSLRRGRTTDSDEVWVACPVARASLPVILLATNPRHSLEGRATHERPRTSSRLEIGFQQKVTKVTKKKLIADVVNIAHPGWDKSAVRRESDHLFHNFATES
jgi:hypothetical protein